MQFSEAGVYLPNKRYSIIMPTHPNIRKNMKITLGGETWKVTGFDNISVKGVSYITLEETFQDEREDIPVANHSELDNWTITTVKGDNFTIENGAEIELLFFYKNKRIVPKFTINGSENIQTTVRIKSFQDEEEFDKIFVTISASETLSEEPFLKVFLDGWDGEDYISVPFSIVPKSEVKTSTIVGPKEIYVGDIYEYIVNGANDNDFDSLRLENDTAKIIEKDSAARTVKIKGMSIGKNKLYTENGLFNFSFEVLSMWLGGN
jgi:hypothetical protein